MHDISFGTSAAAACFKVGFSWKLHLMPSGANLLCLPVMSPPHIGPLLSTDVECIEEATASTESTLSSVTSTPSTPPPLSNTGMNYLCNGVLNFSS